MTVGVWALEPAGEQQPQEGRETGAPGGVDMNMGTGLAGQECSEEGARAAVSGAGVDMGLEGVRAEAGRSAGLA